MDKSVEIKIKFPEDNRQLSQCLSEFLDTTVGRDKIFRLFQYYAKFIIPFIKNKEKLVKLVSFLESFGAICGLTRKMLRIGRYVNAYRNIVARFNKKDSEKELNDVVKSLSDLCNAFYFILDHILLVNKLNVIKFDPVFINKVDWYSNLAWGGECSFNLIYDIIDYYNIINKIKEHKAALKKIQDNDSKEYKTTLESANKLKYEQFRKFIDILRCAFDLPV